MMVLLESIPTKLRGYLGVPYVVKFWSVKKLANCEPFAIFLFANCFDKMAGLLKYFKREVKRHYDKTDGLDTGTLPDPDGPLSRDIPSSTIGMTNTCVRQIFHHPLQHPK